MFHPDKVCAQDSGMSQVSVCRLYKQVLGVVCKRTGVSRCANVPSNQWIGAAGMPWALFFRFVARFQTNAGHLTSYHLLAFHMAQPKNI